MLSYRLQFAGENPQLHSQGPRAALYGRQRQGRSTRYRGQVAKDVRFPRCDENPEEVRTLTAWKAHTMTGDRKGTVSLSVTRNRRLTFRINAAEPEIYDVNLEDYH